MNEILQADSPGVSPEECAVCSTTRYSEKPPKFCSKDCANIWINLSERTQEHIKELGIVVYTEETLDSISEAPGQLKDLLDHLWDLEVHCRDGKPGCNHGATRGYGGTVSDDSSKFKIGSHAYVIGDPGHGSGVDTDDGQSHWIYVICPDCGYQWAYHKILRHYPTARKLVERMSMCGNCQTTKGVCDRHKELAERSLGENYLEQIKEVVDDAGQ